MTETIILIHSGDKSLYFEHNGKKICLWDYWYYYWKKYYTCKYDVIFLSENETRDYPGIKFAHTGAVAWADGLIDYLNKINYKYIEYIHEDYFLTEETNAIKFDELIECMKDNDLKLLKHVGCWAGNPNWNEDGAFKEAFKLGEEMYIYSNEQPYLISHQTAIWDREFLLSTLVRGWSPWCHEITGSGDLRKRNVPIHAYRGKNPLEYCETMIHGEIREGQEKYFDIEL